MYVYLCNIYIGPKIYPRYEYVENVHFHTDV